MSLVFVSPASRGGHRRHDVSTSTRLGQNADLLDRRHGDLRRLYDAG